RGRRGLVGGAESARLLAVAADLHRAPGPRAVTRLVVEGDPAVLVAAALEPLPVVGRRQLANQRDNASDARARSVALRREDRLALLEPDAEVSLAACHLERPRGGF